MTAPARNPDWNRGSTWRRLALSFDEEGFAYLYLRGVQPGWFVIARLALSRGGTLCSAGFEAGGHRDIARAGLDPEAEPAAAWRYLHGRRHPA